MPLRVDLDRLIEPELTDVGEGEDVFQPPLDLGAAETGDRGEQARVLASGEVGVHRRAELEDGRHPALDAHLARGGPQVAGDQLEQGRLARPVATDDSHRAPALDREVDATQRPVLVHEGATPPEQRLEQTVLGAAVEPVALAEVASFYRRCDRHGCDEQGMEQWERMELMTGVTMARTGSTPRYTTSANARWLRSNQA